MNTGREQLEEHLKRKAEHDKQSTLRRAWDHARRYPLLSTVVALVLISTLLSAISSLAAYQAQGNAEDTADRLEEFIQVSNHKACLLLNRNREDSRQLMRRGDIESGEALIETVTSNDGVDPASLEAIERFRENLSRRQQNIIDEHTADDQDCNEVAPLPE